MPIGTSDGEYYPTEMEFHVSPLVAEGKLKPPTPVESPWEVDPHAWDPYPDFRQQSQDFENRTGLVNELMDKAKNMKITDTANALTGTAAFSNDPEIQGFLKQHPEYKRMDPYSVGAYFNMHRYLDKHPEASPTEKEASDTAFKAKLANREEGMEDTERQDFDSRYKQERGQLSNQFFQNEDKMLTPMIRKAKDAIPLKAANITNSPDEILEGVESGTPQAPKGGGGTKPRKYATPEDAYKANRIQTRESGQRTHDINMDIRAKRGELLPDDIEWEKQKELDGLLNKWQLDKANDQEINRLKDLLNDRYKSK